MKRWIPILIMALVMIWGCARTNDVPSAVRSDALSCVAQDISFFASESEVKRPFSIVGTIYYMDPGEYKRLKFSDIVPILEAKAKAMGANGIIVDVQEPVSTGLYGRGIEFSGRAIKF